MNPKDLVRIWSFEHQAWWRPNSRGYTNALEEAGLYDRKEAERICKDSRMPDMEPKEKIVEIKSFYHDKARDLFQKIKSWIYSDTEDGDVIDIITTALKAEGQAKRDEAIRECIEAAKNASVLHGSVVDAINKLREEK